MADETIKKAEFSSGIGTVVRVSEDFAYINYYLRNCDYRNYYSELIIIFKDIWAMCSKINKKGELEDTEAFKNLNLLRLECDKEILRCYNVVKDGQTIFRPTPAFMFLTEKFDRFLRTLAKEYNLYMVMSDDDSNTPSLMRNAIPNYKRY